MSRALRFALLGAAVVSSFGLTSCGDDDASESGADTTADATTDSASGQTTVEPSGDDETAPTSVAPSGDEVEVLALDNNFRPEELEVVAGTTVIWENGGRNDHNIVPVDDGDSWGVDIEEFRPGDVYSYIFTTPGEYAYYCTLHGTADFGMIGTVVVTG